MLYTYLIEGSEETVEIEHPMSQPALTEYTLEDGRTVNVRRLISGGTKFILKGGCWSRDGYSQRIQDPAKEVRELRQLEKSRK